MDLDLRVLYLIKTAQKEHGLTAQSDYTLYRRYCTARLSRLYIKLRRHPSGCMHQPSMSRAKRKMKNVAPRPPFEQDAIHVDINYLLILLFSAERAWSCAMAIKQASRSHQRLHLIARFAKAAKWADLFSRTCARSTNPRTSLEATAYALYMKGSYLMERSEQQHWDLARENFHHAKVVYEALASVESADQEIFRHIVEDEIGPSILHCSHRMHINQSTSVPDEGLHIAATVTDMLAANLAVMMGSSQQVIKNTEYLNWLDRKFALDNARACSCIKTGKRLEAKVVNASKSSPRELALRRKILRAYQDARQHIREDSNMAGGILPDGTEKDDLLGLDRALSCMILQQTLNYKELLASMLKSHLHKHPSEQGNNTQEQKLAGFYDSLLETLTDLSDLVTSGRDPSSGEVAFASQLAFKKLAFQAQRCFYLAQAQCDAAQYAGAHLLYQRAQNYAAAALSNWPQQQLPEDQHIRSIMKELEELSKECRSQCCLVHALGTSEALRAEHQLLQCRFAEMSLNPTKKPKKTAYLSEREDNLYVPSVLSDDGEPPHILQLPPALQAVPCKPFFLDTVVENAIRFPCLEKYLRQKEDTRTSFFGRFWRP